MNRRINVLFLSLFDLDDGQYVCRKSEGRQETDRRAGSAATQSDQFGQHARTNRVQILHLRVSKNSCRNPGFQRETGFQNRIIPLSAPMENVLTMYSIPH